MYYSASYCLMKGVGQPREVKVQHVIAHVYSIFIFLWFNFKVGHEPIPPPPSRTFLGTKVLRLPSFFQYGKLNKTVIKA